MKQGERRTKRNTIVLLAAIGVVSLLALGVQALIQDVERQLYNPDGTVRWDGQPDINGKPLPMVTPMDTRATFSLYEGPIAVYRDPDRNVILFLVSEPPPVGTNNHTTIEQKPARFGNASTIYGLNDASAALPENQRDIGILATPSGIVLRKVLRDATFIDRINPNIFDVESFGGDDPSGFIAEAFEAIKDFHGEYPPNYVPPAPVGSSSQ